MRLVWPRHEISAMLREYTTLSWAAMGAAIGGRDHTTTLNSYNRVSARIAQDAGYADQIGRLKAFVGTFGEPARQQASHLISTARKAMHGTASNKDVSTLAITLLSIASLLGDETLTDAEARQACMALSKNVAVSA